MPKPQRSSKSPLTLLLLLSLMVIATLVVMSNYFLRPAMELNLKNKISKNQFLQALPDAVIKVRGRDVTLSGYVRSQAKAMKAEEMIKEIQGIRQVENQLLIKNQTIE